uniref:Uncharacterized protein n=1 Tax=Musa acuminata subsp. malaccensis TaxID=214687 RepID=A0A804KRM4_MUSAM
MTSGTDWEGSFPVRVRTGPRNHHHGPCNLLIILSLFFFV